MKLPASKTLLALAIGSTVRSASAYPLEGGSNSSSSEADEVKSAELANAPPNCFPAVGFKVPGSVPSSLTNWWCDYSTEYAFVGFSYEITQCASIFSAVDHVGGA